MNKEQLTKVRNALGVFEPFERKHTNLIEALAILDRALAAPEQEPFCYVNVNAQGDVTRTIKREDKWCKTPLYRHPAPQSAQPVAEVLMHEGEKIIDASMAWMDSTPIGTQLYTAPPSREWQDLSPLEMRDVLRNCAASTFDKLAPNWYEVRQFARAIESALRAKNSGEQA